MNEMRRVDVLLVGGGVASVRCARTLRRHGFTGSILIIGDEDHAPYNRPPLSKELLRDDLPDELLGAEPERWYERREVELRLGAKVTDMDAEARNVTLDDGSRVAFGQCLLATGAEPRTVSGNPMMLRTLDDARRLRAAAVTVGPGAAVTVIGGGFIGVEVASALAALGLRPTIIEVSNGLWGNRLGEKLAGWGVARLEDAGVNLRFSAAVTGFDERSTWIGEGRLEHAFAVAGVGVRPRVALAIRAGLETDDGIVTNSEHRTAHPAIWAGGDVARVEGRRVEHWHSAREAGERAALSMLGLPVPPRRAPWVFSEVGGVSLDVIGDARAWEEERWMLDGSVLAYLDGGRIVQLAIIGAALDVERARSLLERAASVAELTDAAR